MRTNHVRSTIIEAKRFIKAAQAALDADLDSDDYLEPSKKSGALRRASMDLTRALAEMRRPN